MSEKYYVDYQHGRWIRELPKQKLPNVDYILGRWNVPLTGGKLIEMEDGLAASELSGALKRKRFESSPIPTHNRYRRLLDQRRKVYLESISDKSVIRVKTAAEKAGEVIRGLHKIHSHYNDANYEGETGLSEVLERLIKEVFYIDRYTTIDPTDLSKRVNEYALANDEWKDVPTVTPKDTRVWLIHNKLAQTRKPEKTALLFPIRFSHGPSGFPDTGHYIIDLMFLEGEKNYNNQYKYVFTIVDSCSRKLYARAMTVKTATKTLTALKECVEEIKTDSEKDTFREMRYITVDDGTEFKAAVRTYILNTLNCHLIVQEAHVHELTRKIDSVHKGLRAILSSSFDLHGDLTWKNKLQEFVYNYNTRTHSALQKVSKIHNTPDSITNDVAFQIIRHENDRRKIVETAVDEWMVENHMQENKKGEISRIGGGIVKCRVKLSRTDYWSKFTKASMQPTWSTQVFQVVKRKHHPVNYKGVEIKGKEGQELPSSRNMFFVRYISGIDSELTAETKSDGALVLTLDDKMEINNDVIEREGEASEASLNHEGEELSEKIKPSEHKSRVGKTFHVPLWWPFYALDILEWVPPDDLKEKVVEEINEPLPEEKQDLQKDFLPPRRSGRIVTFKGTKTSNHEKDELENLSKVSKLRKKKLNEENTKKRGITLFI